MNLWNDERGVYLTDLRHPIARREMEKWLAERGRRYDDPMTERERRDFDRMMVKKYGSQWPTPEWTDWRLMTYDCQDGMEQLREQKREGTTTAHGKDQMWENGRSRCTAKESTKQDRLRPFSSWRCKAKERRNDDRQREKDGCSRLSCIRRGKVDRISGEGRNDQQKQYTEKGQNCQQEEKSVGVISELYEERRDRSAADVLCAQAYPAAGEAEEICEGQIGLFEAIRQAEQDDINGNG